MRIALLRELAVIFDFGKSFSLNLAIICCLCCKCNTIVIHYKKIVGIAILINTLSLSTQGIRAKLLLIYFHFSLVNINSSCIFAPTIRAISSAGSEHLVYTEGVGGSNPSLPTINSIRNNGVFLYTYLDGIFYLHSIQ